MAQLSIAGRRPSVCVQPGLYPRPTPTRGAAPHPPARRCGASLPTIKTPLRRNAWLCGPAHPRSLPASASGRDGGSSGGSGDWEVKAPLRAVGSSSRSRSADASPASVVATTSLGDPSSELRTAADIEGPLAASSLPDNAIHLEASLLRSSAEEDLSSNAAVNLGILAVLGAVAAAKFISVDVDSWDHLTVWELLRQMPESNWSAYDAAVNSNPMLTKACISGTVYTLGDCIAQGVEGRSLGDLDRGRVLRSGTCGFIAHGPLSHLYYQNLDYFFNQVLMVPPGTGYLPFVKLGIDQTIWSVFWNSTYYVLLGIMKLEHPSVILQTVRSSWFDLLKAGWKLWPFAHVITYGVIPVQHRLLWVDAVELVWVTFLSLYAQQQQKDKLAADQLPSAPSDANSGHAAKEIPK